MQIEVKLLGHLLDDLASAGIGFEGGALEVNGPLSVKALARRVGLDESAEYFVMLNETHVDNDHWDHQLVQDGDEVVFCPPLKGG